MIVEASIGAGLWDLFSLPFTLMEWFTLVSTGVGVLLGIGATNFNERVKWKRDRQKALYDSRSKLYAEYLSSLTKTIDSIRLVARGAYPPGSTRSEAADAAFRGAQPLRRQVPNSDHGT
jgi:hypothetical protein